MHIPHHHTMAFQVEDCHMHQGMVVQVVDYHQAMVLQEVVDCH